MTSDADEPFSDPVRVPVEDSIDLHSFSPRDIPSVVESYLEAAIEAGFHEVRLIHGRGKRVQKEVVRRILSQHPRVTEYREAPPGRGGWGATIVWLADARSGVDKRGSS
jgi:DNA-nicking Smr family endonuclease